MQLKKAEREKNNARSGRFSQRIGSTVFEVNVHFRKDGKESLEDKMYRMMKSDLNNERICGNVRLPQAVTERNRRPKGVFAEGENHEDTLPERGSI